MSSRANTLQAAMSDLEQIFVLNSRNAITDTGAVVTQAGGSPLRARQLSNSLTSNADDAVFLNEFLTAVLPEQVRSTGGKGSAAEPLGSIIAYHNGQRDGGSALVVGGDGRITSGHIASTTVTSLIGGSQNINKNVGSPTPGTSPSLGIVQVNSPFLSLPVRNVLPVSLFCSSIPTIEMSRAAPYVNVKIVSPISAVQDGAQKTLTIGSALTQFGEELRAGTFERDVALSPRDTHLPVGVLVPAGSTAGEQSVFGMEMFTMPQTLLNADRELGRHGTPILDKFRPLMSLESVSINIVPAGHAAFAYKEATINIKIYDRSRMQDVAQLLRPDQFGYNYIQLEYGWTHPEDAGANNPYALLINAFRQRELYTVVSANTSLGNDGVVSVSVRCSLKGARDLINLTAISDKWVDTTRAESLFKELNLIVGDVLAEKSALPAEDIRYVETIRSVSKNGAGGNFAISASVVASITQFINSTAGQGSDDVDALRAKLIEVFGKDGKGGEYAAIADKARTVFSGKLQSLESTPELYEFGKRTVSGNIGATSIDTAPPVTNAQGRKYVTFGKATASLFGAPLTSANFGEVQLFFYTFNSDAGAMNRRNIAEFPIEVQALRTAFDDAIKNDPKMPIKKVMRILVSLVNDSTAPAYGIKSKQKKAADKQETEQEYKKRTADNSSYMKQYGCLTPNFKKPLVEYMMDSIRINGQPVLRVHFFDKRSTPHDEALHLLEVSVSGGGSTELMNLVGTLQQGNEKDLQSVLAAAEQAGIVNVNQQKSGAKSYTLNTNSRALKGFIKRTVPSLTYGSPTSVMTSFNVSSIEMQDLETALLIQAANGKRIPGQPQLESPQNDLQIYPMNFSAAIFGCPLIDYAQEFFIDLDTGTSLDNIYVVNGITHSISPGSFKTDLELKLTRTTAAGSAIDSKIRTLLKNIDDRKRSEDTAATRSSS